MLAEVPHDLRQPVERSNNVMPRDLFGTGKGTVHYQRSCANLDADAVLSKLATGKLELECKPMVPAAGGKK